MMPLVATQFHEAGINRKPVKPCCNGGLSTKALDGLRDLHKDIHQDIFGLVAVLQHTEGEVQHISAVGFPQHGERFAATFPQMLKYHFFVHCTL